MANADKWVKASPRQAHEEANLHASRGLSRLASVRPRVGALCEPAIFHLRHASLLPFFFCFFFGGFDLLALRVWNRFVVSSTPSITEIGVCGWGRLQDRECACRDERVDGLRRKRRRRSRCRWNGT
jgi:hypothetical protein